MKKNIIINAADLLTVSTNVRAGRGGEPNDK